MTDFRLFYSCKKFFSRVDGKKQFKDSISHKQELSGVSLVIPRSYMELHTALQNAAMQTGLRYVVTVPKLKGVIGPFTPGDRISLTKLLDAIASKAKLSLSWQNRIAIFQPSHNEEQQARLQRYLTDMSSNEMSRRRTACHTLGLSARIEAIPTLCETIKDDKREIYILAARALALYEGDFSHNEWYGRLSVFELPEIKLPVENLLWLVEEGTPPGSKAWKSAISLLGRAREGRLSRSVWDFVWDKDRVPDAMTDVIWALGRSGDPSCGPCLDRRLRQPVTNIPHQRYVTATALAKLGLIEILNKLLSASSGTDNESIEIRSAIAFGLGYCANGSAIEVLQKCLCDPVKQVRELAVLSLGRIRTPRSHEILSSILLNNEGNISLRVASATALAMQLTPADECKELIESAKDTNPAIRTACAMALGIIGGKKAQETLASLIMDSHKDVVCAAVHALTSIGPYKKVSGHQATDKWGGCATLLESQQTDTDIRIAIAIGMGESRCPEASEYLASVAYNTENCERLRKYSARSLAMLANRAGQSALLKLLESDSSQRITDIPIRYLDMGDPAKTLSYLSKWLTSGTPDEQIASAERIAELELPEGTELLAGGFNVFDNHTRFTHAWALLCFRTHEVVHQLVALVRRNRRSGVRMNAALALAGEWDPLVVETLIDASSDENTLVRRAAINSLGESGDPMAAPALIKAMEQDTDIRVSHSALRALRQFDFANLPEVREAFKRITGTNRDCGVPNLRSIIDQPDNSWILCKFNRNYDDVSQPNLTYESAITYDSIKNQIIQWGAHGRRADSPQTGFTWLFNPVSLSWSRPDVQIEPPGVCLTKPLVFDSNRGLAISASGTGGSHGWIMALRKCTATSIPWIFDGHLQQWYPMHPPLFHPGGIIESAGGYDPYHDMAVFFGSGQVFAYDIHSNKWLSLKPPHPQPEKAPGLSGAYDPKTGRFIVLTGVDTIRGNTRVWAYDIARNVWTELKTENAPPPTTASPMVYDSANDVMLLFRHEHNRISLYVFHLRTNKWEPMPAIFPCPSYGQFDAVYVPEYNVVVLTGGWEWGQSTAFAVRETWTYRYKRSHQPSIKTMPQLQPLKLEINNGNIKLSWNLTIDNEIVRFHVYRLSGENSLSTKFVRITPIPLTANEFVDTKISPDTTCCCYRVTAILKDSEEVPVTYIAYSQPDVVREVRCCRLEDGSVNISWSPSPSTSIVGYNIYRTQTTIEDLWHFTFSAERTLGGYEKINTEPVTQLSFVDTQVSTKDIANESKWLPLYVYVVKAVNSLGQESGPSPATLSIPPAPRYIKVIPLEEGGYLVIVNDNYAEGIKGKHLFRMNSYKSDMAFHVYGAPTPLNVLIDNSYLQSGDRLVYFVANLDEKGQIGNPSNEGWAFNPP